MPLEIFFIAREESVVIVCFNSRKWVGTGFRSDCGFFKLTDFKFSCEDARHTV